MGKWKDLKKDKEEKIVIKQKTFAIPFSLEEVKTNLTLTPNSHSP